MTYEFTARKSLHLTLLASAALLTTFTSSIAKNNDEFASACDSTLSPEDFVECICDQEGGIYWETDTEFGCWQLEPGEFDYRCMKGQPLSSCIVTLPASEPPGDGADKPTIPGAVPGGPGGGEAAPVDSTESGPSATDLETVQQGSAPDSFAPFGAAMRNERDDGFRADTVSDSPADRGTDHPQYDSRDDEMETETTDDSVNQVYPSDSLAFNDESNPFEPRTSIESGAGGPCGAGAASATVMLVVGLSLTGRRRAGF